jgi:hypothetical protein
LVKSGIPAHCVLTEHDGRWAIFVRTGRAITQFERCSSDDAAFHRADEIRDVFMEMGWNEPNHWATSHLRAVREVMVFVDQRNHRRRAEIVRGVVAWLRDASLQGRCPISAIPDDIGPAYDVERILRRLMVRCLAKTADGGWIPTPVLLQPAELVEV